MRKSKSKLWFIITIIGIIAAIAELSIEISIAKAKNPPNGW